MSSKCSIFIATSLDGYISRVDGSIDWLEKANETIPKGEDCGYGEFISTVDSLVMGRHTFEQVLSFPKWYYGDKPVTVVSRTLRELPALTPPTVRLMHDQPATLVRKLAEEGKRHLYIDGGVTIQSFLSAGLIDEMTITVIPVLLGSGRPLFGSLPHDISLRLIGGRTYPCGFVQSTYRVGAEA
jgi:dihydrofolate reductase